MKRRTDEEISAPLYEYDAAIRARHGCFAGVDEAGRGPLCGPVCVAACILDPENPVYGINDSKKLTEKKREALFDEIVEKALAYKIIFVGPEIIDRDNILNATMGGMRQAVEGLDIASSKKTGPLVFNHCLEKKPPTVQCQKSPTALLLFKESSWVKEFCNCSCRICM